MRYDRHLFRQTRRTIGNNIRRLRTARDWTIHKLAVLADVADLQIDHYELGKNEIHLSDMLKIACAFDVEVIELLKA